MTVRTWWRGRPTMEGKTARGASSPAKPALHMPDPLSQTRAVTSSSHIFLSWLYSDTPRDTMLTQLSRSSTARWLVIGVRAYRLPGGCRRTHSRRCVVFACSSGRNQRTLDACYMVDWYFNGIFNTNGLHYAVCNTILY